MAKFSLWYISICESLLGFVLGVTAFNSWFGYGVQHLIEGAILTALSAFCFASGGALVRRARWSLWSAWAIGVTVAALASYFIADAFILKARYTGEEGFGASVGIVLLTPTLIGFALLMLPSTRRYLSQS